MIVKVYHNGDDVFIAWKADGFIAGCRGFALMRRRNGVEEVVSTWVGFAGDPHTEGERRASTDWPIQKYQWTDYMANPGDTVQYRVLPMVGPDRHNLVPDPQHASDWTTRILIAHQVSKRIEAYFNRGIVASQWVSRRLGITAANAQTTKLRTIIATPGDPFRNFLAGPLGDRLFALLASAAREKRDVYAALYELDDEQLESALEACGPRAHVILANGSVARSGDDQNARARARLAPRIDLHDRMTSPKALGHNKFLVICDARGKPRWVWTGSQNWTKTGLCTQANNSLLIDDRHVAAEYRAQWDGLIAAASGTPDALRTSNSRPRDHSVGGAQVRLWFTPTIGLVDLIQARKIILAAKRAILFLMFNPGPKETLLNTIIAAARQRASGSRLYIHGVINQDPSTTANPVQLFDKGNAEQADYEVVLPAAIDEITAFWNKELKQLPGTFAMVHSKVVLIDPFGTHPMVMTGSHNLGPKASGTNDENLLLVRDAAGLAAAYATNIMSIYNQYRWRFRRHTQPLTRQWDGLQDTDTWQYGYLRSGSAARREIDFWVNA